VPLVNKPKAHEVGAALASNSSSRLRSAKTVSSVSWGAVMSALVLPYARSRSALK